MIVEENRLIQIAEEMVGISGKRYGRNAEEGFDCWGMTIEFFRHVGLDVQDFVDPKNLRNSYSKRFIPDFEEIDDIKPFCLVIFNLASTVVPDHVMIAISKYRLLNVSLQAGVHTVRFSKWRLFSKFFAWHKELEINPARFIKI